MIPCYKLNKLKASLRTKLCTELWGSKRDTKKLWANLRAWVLAPRPGCCSHWASSGWPRGSLPAWPPRTPPLLWPLYCHRAGCSRWCYGREQHPAFVGSTFWIRNHEQQLQNCPQPVKESIQNGLYFSLQSLKVKVFGEISFPKKGINIFCVLNMYVMHTFTTLLTHYGW